MFSFFISLLLLSSLIMSLRIVFFLLFLQPCSFSLSKLAVFFDNLLFAQDGHNALDIAQLNGKAGIVGLLTVRILFHDAFLQCFVNRGSAFCKRMFSCK
jgi:hypothetical protein